MAEFVWTDKVDGVDDVYAKDVNDIAHGVAANAENVGIALTEIGTLESELLSQREDIRNLGEVVSDLEVSSSGRNIITISPYTEDERLSARADYTLNPTNGSRNVEIINEAIQLLKNEGGNSGGEIVFFGGLAPLSKGINIDLDNVKLSGNGIQFKLSPMDGDCFSVSGENVSVSDFNFSETNPEFFTGNIFSITGSGFSAENCTFSLQCVDGWVFHAYNASYFSAKNCVINGPLAPTHGFYLRSYHSNVSNCEYYTTSGYPLIVYGADATIISNNFSSFMTSEFNASGAKVFGNKFETRDIVTTVKGGSGNVFVGNEFVDSYGFEFEGQYLLKISDDNILVGNKFIPNYSSLTYPALEINGSNNIYVANILDGVLDNGTNNITYLTSTDKTTVNNTLESESETEALSANMGRELNSKIATLEESISGVETILADANAVADSYIEGGTA